MVITKKTQTYFQNKCSHQNSKSKNGQKTEKSKIGNCIAYGLTCHFLSKGPLNRTRAFPP